MIESEMLSNLVEKLGNILQIAVAGHLEEKYSGHILPNQVFRSDGTGTTVAVPPFGTFIPNQSYLQVMINHMYVSQSRRLWIEREHLGAVWMSFRYDGEFRTVPFMVGRDLLIDKVDKLPDEARIEFQDVRIGKVYPYTGDSLALYLGLWSTPTVDWASTIFSALDTIAGKVKIATSLSQVLDMVDVLNQGISTVLGLKKIEAHLNLYQEFQDPTVGDVGLLEPGYYVIIDVPKAGFDPSTLRVLDGKLHIQRSTDAKPELFYDHDFLLYSISSPGKLSTAVDMFAKQYEAVLVALIGTKSGTTQLAQAAQEYHTLQTQIVTSPDLTKEDKNRLLTYYSENLDQDAARLRVNIQTSDVAFATTPKPPEDFPLLIRQTYEAWSSGLDAAQLAADPAVLAGEAAYKFAASLQMDTGAQ